MGMTRLFFPFCKKRWLSRVSPVETARTGGADRKGLSAPPFPFFSYPPATTLVLSISLD